MSWVWGTGIRGEPTPKASFNDLSRADSPTPGIDTKPSKVARFLAGIGSTLSRPTSGQDIHNHGIMIDRAESKSGIAKANSQPNQDKEE